MKYKQTESIRIFLIVLVQISMCSELSNKSFSNKPVKIDTTSKEDLLLTRIQKYIYDYADKITKNSDLKLKRKINGQLPDSYPKIMIKNAKKRRLDRDYWNKLLKYPTEVWRFCVYPEALFKNNVMNWCDNKYGSKNPKKLASCKNTFCTVCCDHLRIVLKNQAQKQIIGEILSLKNNPGFNKIVRSITDHDLNKCRSSCSNTFPVNFPVILPPPPRDMKLGKNPQNSAKNCKDIQRWGDKNSRSGQYWIDLGQRGKTKVYCDMEIDGGGWELFFNYLHYPGQEVYLDTSKPPSNLKENSHINLKDVGFSENEVSELRFFCTERSNLKQYWHFKVSNLEFINVALSGDQRFLKKSSILGGYHDLPFPGKPLKWVRAMDKDRIKKINLTGQNRAGGFWDSPFGSNKYKMFWTVKGNVKKGGRFECGTSHKDGMTNPLASLVMTHHTVWFRGTEPSVDEARTRFVERNTKLNK